MNTSRVLVVLGLIALAATSACDKKSAAPATPVAPVSPAKLDTVHAKKVSTRVPDGQTFKGLGMSHSLPYIIQLGKHGDLKIEGEGTTNIIFDGEATLGPDAKSTGLEKSLRIQNFATTTDTALVQVDVGQGADASFENWHAAGAEAPVLIDTKNDKYYPVGFFYEDETKLIVRFTPGDVIQEMSKIPTLSRSRPAQKLTLLFRVSAGRSVKYFAVGNSAVVEYDPPVAVTQGNR